MATISLGCNVCTAVQCTYHACLHFPYKELCYPPQTTQCKPHHPHPSLTWTDPRRKREGLVARLCITVFVIDCHNLVVPACKCAIVYNIMCLCKPITAVYRRGQGCGHAVRHAPQRVAGQATVYIIQCTRARKYYQKWL